DRSPQNLLMCWFSVPAWSHNHTLQVAARKNTPRHLSTDGRLKSDQSRSTSFGTRSTTPSPSATDSFGAQMEMYSLPGVRATEVGPRNNYRTWDRPRAPRMRCKISSGNFPETLS